MEVTSTTPAGAPISEPQSTERLVDAWGEAPVTDSEGNVLAQGTVIFGGPTDPTGLRPGDFIAPERLYLDKSGKVVPEGPDIFELFAAEGTIIRKEDAERVGYQPPQQAQPAQGAPQAERAA